MKILPVMMPMLLISASAWAQLNPAVAEPSVGDRLGGWFAFLIALAAGIVIYFYRRRRAGDIDPSAPTGTRMDAEH
ncbi:MAG: hypothetical protein ABWZ80_07555 [Beijerinckiaceae bacterium]